MIIIECLPFQLGGICSQLNNTYSIRIKSAESQPAIDIGPKILDGSGWFNEMLSGELEANMQYTVQLEVSFPYYMDERSIIRTLVINLTETSINQLSFCGSTVINRLNNGTC